MKKVAVFGSTGFIGRMCLEVIERWKDKFKVVGLSCRKNVGLLKEQVKKFHPEAVYIAEGGEIDGVKCFSSWEELLNDLDFDLFVSAASGSSGFLPTLKALEMGKKVALANKETVVMGGKLIKKHLEKIIPVDSEHSSIFRLVRALGKNSIKNIYLTASGGPFIDRDNLDEVTPEEAIKHPNWNMGKKISVDSATLMNKGLEVIEAHFLFSIPKEKIKVVVHRQSFVHALVEAEDGTLFSHMYPPDMRIPISYALFYPDTPPPLREHNLYGQTLSFEEVDRKKFPSLDLCYRSLETEGAPIVLNAANEEAVYAFLRGDLPFRDIVKVVEEVLNTLTFPSPSSIDEILEIDRMAREKAGGVIKKWKR